jgi:hypothetical protein
LIQRICDGKGSLCLASSYVLSEPSQYFKERRTFPKTTRSLIHDLRKDVVGCGDSCGRVGGLVGSHHPQRELKYRVFDIEWDSRPHPDRRDKRTTENQCSPSAHFSHLRNMSASSEVMPQ